MDSTSLKFGSAYAGSCMILATKHSKSIALAEPLWDILGASTLEYVVDTDRLGTFTGEIERAGTPLDCARRKCELIFEGLGSNVDYALASEGSFGAQPVFGFLPCDHELLYFIDRRHDFHLHVSAVSSRTNYRMQSVTSWAAMQEFADAVGFPSHAIIIRPGGRETSAPIFKGIDSLATLEDAYGEARRLADNNTVWAETDMRAHMNPTRMAVIGELAAQLATRLAARCPRCATPGWGRIRLETGLECRDCGTGTALLRREVFGCVKCDCEQVQPRSDALRYADPEMCPRCNP